MRKNSIQEKLIQTAMNDLPTGAFICDREGIVQFMNRAYANYLGMRPEDAVGRPILKLIPTSRIAGVLRTGKAELRQIRRFPNGATLLVNRVPLFDDDGELMGALSMTLFDTCDQVKELLQSVRELDKEINYCHRRIKSVLSSPYTIDSIIGESRPIRKMKELLLRYAPSDAAILLLGDTGSGKELAAGAIHAASPRSGGPFVSINCAAIPKDLFESEVFGYVAGAFSGARKDGSPGKIEAADNGTLFLDEVGDLPLPAQAKFLRVLEEKSVVPLGSTKPRPVDFRLIAATNRDLEHMIETGAFREDLYYRINSMKLHLPPLAERQEDIPALTRSFLEHMGRGSLECSPEAMQALETYSWPGNVRELRNAIGHAASLCRNGRIEVEDLPADCLREAKRFIHSPLLHSATRDAEAEAIHKAIAACGGNRTRAAAMLGISRSGLYVKLKKIGAAAAE